MQLPMLTYASRPQPSVIARIQTAGALESQASKHSADVIESVHPMWMVRCSGKSEIRETSQKMAAYFHL